MASERGEFTLSKKGEPLVEVKGKKLHPARGEVSQTLLNRLADFVGHDVEFERVRGKPKQIREVDGSFVPPGQETPKYNPAPDRDERKAPRARGDFHNPYNFVSAPPRETKDPDLGDQPPVVQDAFLADRYTGSIRVRMTAKTPLLVPDIERMEENDAGHKTYLLRVDSDGKPLIPASSARGMLRCAYETITNSRFGRFPHRQHRERLAYRTEARAAAELVPARVENDEIRLLTGTSGVKNNGKPDGPQYAAWLPSYWNGRTDKYAPKYSNGELPKHRHEVVCWVEKIHYESGKRNFDFWRVREIVRGEDTDLLGSQPPPSSKRNKSEPATPARMEKVHGWVCVTNANIKGKHDERVFFSNGGRTPGPFPVEPEHEAKWRELIRNYQNLHEGELRKRRSRNQNAYDYLGPHPGDTAWSRHVYTPEHRELTEGTLCYVRLNENQSDVGALYPVMIARDLYEISPWDILDESLHPAATIDQLSPADRVFGWVTGDADTETRSKGERVAVRGLLRVGALQCESSTADAMERFDEPGVPLAILSAPKPQQGRFYVAKSPNGEPQKNRLGKVEAGYSEGKELRGRKVYPHQQLPERHWDNPTEDETQQGKGNPAHYQEYRRPRINQCQEQRDDQNRSILGWVKPGAQFSFDLHVHNLSPVELGALLWLLDLPDDHFLRFGGGKPLGFGSVRLKVESCDLRTGQALRERYKRWLDESPASDPRETAVEAFRIAMTRVYQGSAAPEFKQIRFIEAFLTGCRGHADGLPTHYPRATADGQPGPPNPEGESFRWFVANEKNGARYALPDLDSDGGLPTLPGKHKGG